MVAGWWVILTLCTSRARRTHWIRIVSDHHLLGPFIPTTMALEPLVTPPHPLPHSSAEARQLTIYTLQTRLKLLYD